jgi:hypothetical protein
MLLVFGKFLLGFYIALATLWVLLTIAGYVVLGKDVFRLLLFRVVGYLPGTTPHAAITHCLRAGVAQASMVETAELILAGVPGANAMGI